MLLPQRGLSSKVLQDIDCKGFGPSMARRKNSSVFEDLFSIATMLPWWIGVALAVVAYALISSFAVMPEIDPLQPTAHIQQSMIYPLALYGQYIVPGLLLMGAAKSFYDRQKRKKLLSNVRDSSVPATEPLSLISWREFEMLVGQYFQEKGYRVHETGGAADGGVDLRLTASDYNTYLVQCKHWKAGKVPVNVVRELFGVMTAENAQGGFVVTSGQFTAEAQNFADKTNIKLIDGKLLVGSMKGRSTDEITQKTSKTAPSCPICNSSMVVRTARKGLNAGNQFYGCSRFPDCRGTRAYE
ncbi:restriction endonuclease [Alkalimonas sp. NCh-2]|uniref:restriction endonuclease n=1 Tax=Alkalimonas sp. NCh-2 TaxID=3144846 RepID=UPI0031F690D2